ncbi:MAG TPA: rhodanese-like domain-containing protein, partial [Anaerolineae bacterium]|nr:rhodanese-like domain-containing protein [Anaerolineae bacterium]
MMRYSARWLMFLIAATLLFAGCSPAATATPTAPLQPVTPTQPAAAPLPAEISVAEAVAKRDAGAFVLDVRQPEEWNEGHIPGAKLIPLDQLEQRVNEVPRDKDVVVVCQSGGRSKQGCALLRQAGYTQ